MPVPVPLVLMPPMPVVAAGLGVAGPNERRAAGRLGGRLARGGALAGFAPAGNQIHLILGVKPTSYPRIVNIEKPIPVLTHELRACDDKRIAAVRRCVSEK